MPNLARPVPARQILSREPAQRMRVPRGRLVAGVLVLAALLALAWMDGGEEPLHLIAQEIELPGAAR